MAAIIDANKCTGCGECVESCPTEAIEMKENKAVVKEECVDCGSCVDACPVEAISMP